MGLALRAPTAGRAERQSRSRHLIATQPTLKTRRGAPAATGDQVTLDLAGATVALAAMPAQWPPRLQPMGLVPAPPLRQAQAAPGAQGAVGAEAGDPRRPRESTN